ncbi:MAG TPA: winged helix-turn-helix domain-containing protein, partial [Gemmatimonadaceae bacterium]|nr:winged helix-turn-helix domain-containing protein [Gemmatimonadaceae bacterium]
MSSDPSQLPKSIRFGDDFELNPRTHQLLRSGRPLKLERIPMEMLLLLTERRGQLVSREQIAERIWGKGHYLDTDNSINGAVRKIRHVLGDDPEQPRFIQTVTGRGYCFIAPVREAEEPRLGETVPTTPTAEELAPLSRPRARRWPALGLTMAVVLALALAAWVAWSRSRASGPVAGRVMLAVLPFQNLTGDAALEYLSDGLTEEMIAQLGTRDPERLGVIARTSVMTYKNDHRPLDQIERELGVQYVLEGSVRRDASRLRVAAQLIQATDQTHIWARQYDRELSGLLTLQGEIAQQIAAEILSRIGSPEAGAGSQTARSTDDFEAYDLYLKGQFFLAKRTTADLERAVGYFRQATMKDTSYARAHAALAHSYTLLAGYSRRPPREFVRAARASALRALALDESLPEAHTAVALIVQNHDWDWQTAEREYRRAIELNPNYATAHHWYAEHLMWRGRFDEAIRESDVARQLDPLSLIIATDHAVILLNARQYDRAIEQFRSVLELDPDFPRAHIIEAAYVEKGMVAEALADLETQRSKLEPHWYWFSLTGIYTRSGQTAQARHAAQEFLRLSPRDGVQPSVMAGAFLAMGDREQALAWL